MQVCRGGAQLLGTSSSSSARRWASSAISAACCSLLRSWWIWPGPGSSRSSWTGGSASASLRCSALYSLTRSWPVRAAGTANPRSSHPPLPQWSWSGSRLHTQSRASHAACRIVVTRGFSCRYFASTAGHSDELNQDPDHVPTACHPVLRPAQVGRSTCVRAPMRTLSTTRRGNISVDVAHSWRDVRSSLEVL